jgi:hypothetical protein
MDVLVVIPYWHVSLITYTLMTTPCAYLVLTLTCQTLCIHGIACLLCFALVSRLSLVCQVALQCYVISLFYMPLVQSIPCMHVHITHAHWLQSHRTQGQAQAQWPKSKGRSTGLQCAWPDSSMWLSPAHGWGCLPPPRMAWGGISVAKKELRFQHALHCMFAVFWAGLKTPAG